MAWRARRILLVALVVVLVLGVGIWGAGVIVKSNRLKQHPPQGNMVDAAPDDLFNRIPLWRNAIAGKVGLYRTLVPLSSFGLLAFAPGSIPNRGMADDVLAQHRAIAVSTGYFQTATAESEAFESNLAEVYDAHVSLGVTPLIVLSRGYWDPVPGFSEAENEQAWQEMQSELLSLSSNSEQIVATKSEHHIQLQQPEIVIEAIRDVKEAVHNANN